MSLYPAYGPVSDNRRPGPKCRPKVCEHFWCNQAVSNNSEEMQHVE
jgi:hypothetical protein